MSTYVPSDCIHDVTINGVTIQSVVTDNANVAANWIRATESVILNNFNRNTLTIGLDVEWRPTFGANIRNPIAIIQLCVGNRCLVYQILHSNNHCTALQRFLQEYKFVGVGIQEDADKLYRDYGLEVWNAVDLRNVAVGINEENAWMRNVGLKTMAESVLGIYMEKPRWVTLSRWDAVWLSLEQVKYAVEDAYVSFELGIAMEAYKYC